MKKLIRLSTITAFMAVSSAVMAQDDLLIYRNGGEKAVRIIMVSGSEVTYSEYAKSGPEQKESLKDIYMLRYSKRGNVYITDDCKRITGENQKYDKNADIIYLIDGKEILAYNLQILEDKIIYEEKGKTNLFGKKTAGSDAGSKMLNVSDVFFIKYKDGTKDIINDISREAIEAKERAKREEEERVRQAQLEEEMKKANEKKVIFHNVKKGETLAVIAKRYHVTAREIITWNELPANTKPTIKLKPDMQLMIYVNPETSN